MELFPLMPTHCAPKLYFLLAFVFLSRGLAVDEINCCSGDYSLVDCSTTRGAKFEGSIYLCYDIGEISKACMVSEWLFDEEAVDTAGVSCRSACGNISSCLDDWAWASIVSMLFISGFFMICSVICIRLERRRKRKGMTIAQAYRLPMGIPLDYNSSQTGVDNGERRRRIRVYASTGDIANQSSIVGYGSFSANDDDPLENDFKYEAEGENLPVAKLAEDDCVPVYAVRANGIRTPPPYISPPVTPSILWRSRLFRLLRPRQRNTSSSSISSSEDNSIRDNNNPYIEI